MPGHGAKLPQRQEQAIAALLAHDSILAAARAVPVDEKTLRTWMKAPTFAEAYRDARRQVMTQAIARIQQVTHLAVGCLLSVMQDPEAPASARVSAAKAILDIAVKAVETEDLDTRVKVLEAAMLSSN